MGVEKSVRVTGCRTPRLLPGPAILNATLATPIAPPLSPPAHLTPLPMPSPSTPLPASVLLPPGSKAPTAVQKFPKLVVAKLLLFSARRLRLHRRQRVTPKATKPPVFDMHDLYGHVGALWQPLVAALGTLALRWARGRAVQLLAHTWHTRFGCWINGQHAAVVTGVNGNYRVPKHPTGTAPQGRYALCATANVLCCMVWCRLAEFVPQEANFALLPNLVCTNGSNFCS